MTVEMQSVASSNIEAVGHDPQSNTLWVRFKGGSGTYTYPDVDADLYERLRGASSVGQFFHANIRQTRKGSRAP